MSTKANKAYPQEPAGVRKTAHGAKSDAVRDQAVLALLSEKTLEAAAERCGVNEKTLRRWISGDDQFKQDLAEARRAAFQAGMSRVQALANEAVETLAALMAPDVSPAVRLGAARTIAELGIHQHDGETILRKLDEIESYQRQQDEWRR
jgi:hypothetical protein